MHLLSNYKKCIENCPAFDILFAFPSCFANNNNNKTDNEGLIQSFIDVCGYLPTKKSTIEFCLNLFVAEVKRWLQKWSGAHLYIDLVYIPLPIKKSQPFNIR